MVYIERGSCLKERQDITALDHGTFSAPDMGVRSLLRVKRVTIQVAPSAGSSLSLQSSVF